MKTKLYDLFSYKNIMRILFVVSIISLIPLLYCSFFDYATGDDLWEGAAVYRVFRENGSIKDLILAVWGQLKTDYMGWQGNWSSSILWYFSPNVFGEKIYIITPWIGLVSIIGSYWYAFKHFNQKYLGLNREFFVIIYLLISVLTIQYMPYIRGGLFWYSGMINYTFPHGLVVSAAVWLDKYLETGRKAYFVYLVLVYAFMGGSGYLAIVLSFEVIVLSIIIKRKTKRARYLLFPLFLLLVGFTISALSPGNAVRGRESYGFSFVNIIYTLKECVIQGAAAIPETLWRVKYLLLLLPFIVIGIWENLDTDKSKIKFNRPLIVIPVLFLISCSMYAPGIYANNHLSGGVYDTIYYVFVLAYFFILIYLVGFIKKTRKQSGNRVLKPEIIRVPVCMIILAVNILGMSIVLNHSAYQLCVDYIATGQLRDFEYQMQERLAILLDPEIKEVVLPAMNDWQGPFMHMCIMEDPKAYTNQATARYYNKNSVVVMPREEYYRTYGYPDTD